MPRSAVSLLVLGLLVACRDDLKAPQGGSGVTEPDPTDSVSGVDDPEGPDMKIEDAAAPIEAGLPTEEAGAGHACSGQRAAVAELTAGWVQSRTALALEGVVATSQKFLVSGGPNAKTCWFGAFVADAGRSGANSGLLLLAAAPRVDGELPCSGGRDGLPDDLAPGDVLEAFGTFTEFVPSACPERAPQLELVVHDACPVRRSARGAAEAPSALDPAFAADLALGNDPGLLAAWGGALVQLNNVTALRDGESADVVGPYGVVKLAESPLEVHDKIFFYDLSSPGPGSSAKAPSFPFPTEFRAITGIVYLDYCTWSLAPRNKCIDFDPPSEDCP